MATAAERPTGGMPFRVIDRIARRVVARQLDGTRRGEIVLRDAAGSTSFGQPGDLRAGLRVHNPRFFRHALMGGTLSVAESYLRGDWDCDDLTNLFRIFVRNDRATNRLDRSFARLAGYGHRLWHWWRANTRSGSRRNIGAHYDLGNDFFRLWLDDTMAYSCGIFHQEGASLRAASIEKFDRVCRKLQLQPSDELLEIGSGWGGFAIHAATNYGCRVTTTTISNQQLAEVQQRVKRERLADRVTMLQQDYRDLLGSFNKLVSIEMIEAVGHRFLDRYFSQCGRLLTPDGSMVLQAIVMPDRGYRRYLKSVDFIQRYVFPGGCLPSLGTILASVARTTDLRLVHAEDFAPHYAETLRRWRSNLNSRIAEVYRLGYSDELLRLWNYYFCYCEAAFEERRVGVLQLHFDKPECRSDHLSFSETQAIRADRCRTIGSLVHS